MSLLMKTPVLPVQNYFPGSPYDGQTFIHATTGRKIEYSYDALTGLWTPKQSHGTIRLYVDPVNGTDDLNHGIGTLTNAFATLQYAIDSLPRSIDGSSTIIGHFAVVITCAGTIAENLHISGKIGPTHSSRIYIHGPLTTIVNGVATGGAQGGGAVTPSVTGAFVPGANEGRLIGFTSGANNDEFRIIGHTTAGTMYLNGRALPAAPVNGDTYTIYDWGTILQGCQILDFGAFPIEFGQIRFNFANLPAGWDSYGLAVYADSTIVAYNCMFYNDNSVGLGVTTGVVSAQGGWVRMENCYAESYGALSMLRAENSAQLRAIGVKLLHDDTGFGSGFAANRQGHIYMDSCEAEGYNALVAADRDASVEIVTTEVNSFLHGAKLGAGIGLYAANHGIVNGLAGVTFGLELDGVTPDANPGGNTFAQAASFSWIG